MLREVLDVLDVLDDPAAGAAEFNSLLPEGVCDASVAPFEGELGKTEFVAYRFKGRAGRQSGGESRTMGIVGSLGGLRLPGDYPGLNSDADGCIVALACALRLAHMWERGLVLKGDVVVTTHICQAAHPEPHDPLPFVMPPMPVDDEYRTLIEDEMEAILAPETCKGNKMMSRTGFAVTPPVKEGYILRPHASLLHAMEMVTTHPAVVFPLTMQDITPFHNGIHHVCGMMLPAQFTNAPVVGVPVTADVAVVPAATGVYQTNVLEATGRYCIEVATAYGNGDCHLFYEGDFNAMVARYGSMHHLLK
ncbi:DUF1177 family protein [Afifella pfennigii]|uniref:DUF1177 family protein n=1 Tax=Afifella pfennigii TaxID=209897 RepID=UPI00047D1AA0|nr:DUF1177 family protein [Afifella pfennigii]